MIKQWWILLLAVVAVQMTPALTANLQAADAPVLTNHLATVDSLSGKYVAVRHGESVPSSEKRVCSSMEAGIDPKNGLTEKGRQEVKDNTQAWIDANKKALAKWIKKDKLVIVTSPFSRTKETAGILADTLQAAFKKSLPAKYRKGDGLRQIIREDADLKERNFSKKFEGKLNSHKIYEKIWKQDKKNPAHTKWGVESANSVQERSTALITRLDEEAKKAGGKLFILVSHGDTIKILQTGFQKQSAAEHENKDFVKSVKTAEFRELSLK